MFTVIACMLTAGFAGVVGWVASRLVQERLPPQSTPTSQTPVRSAGLPADAQHALLERLDLATQVGGLGIWDWNVLEDRMDISASVAQTLGINELTLTHGARAFFTRVVHPDDRSQFSRMLDRSLHGDAALSFRYRTLRPDGRLMHIQITGRIFRDAEGMATRVLGVTTDITAEIERAQQLQRQADQERSLRDRLNLATQTAGIGVWELDPATRIMVADENLPALLGYDGTLDRAALQMLSHESDRDTVTAILDRALSADRQDGLVSFQHRIVRPDGKIAHLQTHLRTCWDPTRRPLSVLGVTWDITETVEHAAELRRQAERVQELLDRFGAAIEAAGMSPWEMDARSGRYIWAEIARARSASKVFHSTNSVRRSTP